MAKVRPIPKPGKRPHFIREWRKYRELTQERLAERIGKTHGAISQLETGKIEYTQGMLEALADALRCEPGDLISVNPMVEGEVIDLVALLRHAPAHVRELAVRSVTAMLRTGTDATTSIQALPTPANNDGGKPRR